jgi:peroxiredoxin Q/BCP
MKSIAVGDRAPDFSQSDQNSQQLSLADFRGKKTVVLFFYPADERDGFVVRTGGRQE